MMTNNGRGRSALPNDLYTYLNDFSPRSMETDGSPRELFPSDWRRLSSVERGRLIDVAFDVDGKCYSYYDAWCINQGWARLAPSGSCRLILTDEAWHVFELVKGIFDHYS